MNLFWCFFVVKLFFSSSFPIRIRSFRMLVKFVCFMMLTEHFGKLLGFLWLFWDMECEFYYWGIKLRHLRSSTPLPAYIWFLLKIISVVETLTISIVSVLSNGCFLRECWWIMTKHVLFLMPMFWYWSLHCFFLCNLTLQVYLLLIFTKKFVLLLQFQWLQLWICLLMTL